MFTNRNIRPIGIWVKWATGLVIVDANFIFFGGLSPWSIKVSIAAQKFAYITDWKGSDTTWELRMVVYVCMYGLTYHHFTSLNGSKDR